MFQVRPYCAYTPLMMSRFATLFTKLRPAWLLIAAASLVPALLNAVTSYLSARFAGRASADWSALAFAALLWMVFGLLTLIPYALAQRYPLRRETLGRSVAAHCTGASLFWLGWTLMGGVLGLLLRVRSTRDPLPRYFVTAMLSNLTLCVFVYFTVLGCIFAFSYYQEAREREAQQARLAAQLAEARLSALRMQLNPHFLFNSLNAIAVLVRDQNTRDASRMLELLGGVLRQVLQSKTRQEVTLDEELRFIEKYLAIEQVRFSDRLQVRWSVEDSVRDALAPEFVLQPLVENAIRHGVAKRGAAGLIDITARASDNEVVLSIQDDGPGYHPVAEAGVGLANTRARLATLFGEAGQLQVVNAEGGGAIATVRFPMRRRSDG